MRNENWATSSYFSRAVDVTSEKSGTATSGLSESDTTAAIHLTRNSRRSAQLWQQNVTPVINECARWTSSRRFQTSIALILCDSIMSARGLSNSRLRPKLTQRVYYRGRIHLTRAQRVDGRILDGPKTHSSHPGRWQSNLRGADWRLQATGGHRPQVVAAAAAAAATPSFGSHSSTHRQQHIDVDIELRPPEWCTSLAVNWLKSLIIHRGSRLHDQPPITTADICHSLHLCYISANDCHYLYFTTVLIYC